MSVWCLSSWDVLRNARTVVTTAATAEPVTLAEAKDHVRRTESSVDDALLYRLIQASREKVEADTGRALMTQTRDVYCDVLPYAREALRLPLGKLQSVTSVKTYDTLNVESTLSTASYLVDSASEPGRIALNDGYDWPSGLRNTNAVIVRAVFGYGSAGSVPQPLKQAMLLLLGAMYEHREQVIVAQFAGQFLELPRGYDQLIAGYRLEVV